MIVEKDHDDRVAQAFSYKASIYDEFGKDHPNLERMRNQVRAQVIRFIRSGDRILEINAGTGADAVYFAKRGYRLLATDLSPGMIASTQEKIEEYGLQANMSAQLCSFKDLLALEGRPFDYIFSNFGGLNCIDDLSLVTRQLPQVLRPGGRLTWVIMPPVCPWELAAALRGDFRTAFRRLRRSGVLANVEDVRFHVRYFTPDQVMRSLGKEFQLLALEGLSFFAPPADHKDFARRHPRLYTRLVNLDSYFSRLPVFRGWGDFFILTAEYRP